MKKMHVNEEITEPKTRIAMRHDRKVADVSERTAPRTESSKGAFVRFFGHDTLFVTVDVCALASLSFV